MTIIKKDALVTFRKKPDNNAPISEDDNIFSIPYSKIIAAENFCKREGLKQCLLGFRNYNWIVQVTDKNITHGVIITQVGIEDSRYDYILAEDTA